MPRGCTRQTTASGSTYDLEDDEPNTRGWRRAAAKKIDDSLTLQSCQQGAAAAATLRSGPSPCRNQRTCHAAHTTQRVPLLEWQRQLLLQAASNLRPSVAA